MDAHQLSISMVLKHHNTTLSTLKNLSTFANLSDLSNLSVITTVSSLPHVYILSQSQLIGQAQVSAQPWFPLASAVGRRLELYWAPGPTGPAAPELHTCEVQWRLSGLLVPLLEGTYAVIDYTTH